MARFASATSAPADEVRVNPGPQDIELVEYPARRTTGTPHSEPTKVGSRTPQPSLQPQPFKKTGHRPSGRLRWGQPVKVRYWVEALHRRSKKTEDCDTTTPKMKFSHSIQFNAVPDWSAYYIAYSNLKKLYVGNSPSGYLSRYTFPSSLLDPWETCDMIAVLV